MPENSDLLFGTKILNHLTNEIVLLIKTWKNELADEAFGLLLVLIKKISAIILNLMKLSQGGN